MIDCDITNGGLWVADFKLIAHVPLIQGKVL